MPYLLAWIPAAAMAIDVKHVLLTVNGGGFELLAQLLSISWSNALPWRQKLALYREDLLLVGVVVPIVLLLVLRLLKPRLRAALVGCLAIIATTALFVELKVFWEVRTFLPLSTLLAGIAGPGREFLQDYFQLGSVAKAVGLIGSTIILAAAAFWLDLHGDSKQARSPVRVLQAGVTAFFAVVLIAVLFLYAQTIPPNPYRTSAFTMSLKTFLNLEGRNPFAAAVEHVEPDQLLQRYRELTNAPVPNQPSALWAKAAGYDVIAVVLETAPAACVDLADTVHYPNITSLLPHSIVAPYHHSSYPYTTRAAFSIYSSWYPANGIGDFVKVLDAKYPELKAPGLPQSLRAAGYRTAVFDPEDGQGYNWEHDHSRYAALGFAEQNYPSRTKRPAELTQLQWRRSLDVDLLRRLKENVRESIARKQHYFVAFSPQYTHAPWPNVATQIDLDNTCAAGVPLFQQVDAWIGEILQVLRDAGTISRTIIVVTGDHGVRTNTEHPGFRGGTLDDISFHVPFVMYAPGVLTHTLEITHVTSHIDIAPSILDLLGVSQFRGLEQGSPMWDSRLSTRTTFFLAQDYLGADGYCDGQDASEFVYLFHGTYIAPWTGTLRFSPANMQTSKSPGVEAVRNKILEFSALQKRWSEMMIPSKFDHFFAPPQERRRDAQARLPTMQ